MLSIEALTRQGGRTPDALVVDDVTLWHGDSRFVRRFHSHGQVDGRIAFAGYNVLVFTGQAGRLRGFGEYLGLVRPEWFK